nr:MAG TPA: hypothetical protein [Caudoviricetes sp.]
MATTTPFSILSLLLIVNVVFLTLISPVIPTGAQLGFKITHGANTSFTKFTPSGS